MGELYMNGWGVRVCLVKCYYLYKKIRGLLWLKIIWMNRIKNEVDLVWWGIVLLCELSNWVIKWSKRVFYYEWRC